GADVANLAVAQRARSRIVYVSCDPQTLSRDARRLGAAGFHLSRAVALDLMPQTYHVEVVAIFDRAK
ncbi:MAG TPA: 23S rRNA (uracil(1939)-C(5))-methyltransferase RlmD, partial [Polyangia bacterium]|nr:23S rRNA (uracil(1939)-C(5))-methyltransferase RlmD [Polyangia bacterium]